MSKTTSNRFSVGTFENTRYHRDRSPLPDHKNEDFYFVLDNEKFKACAVFDGHDGPLAAHYAQGKIKGDIDSGKWLPRRNNGKEDLQVEAKLKEYILLTDVEFFKQMSKYIEEKKQIEATISPGLKSYEAQQHYPGEVARLEELEPLISGGCTAVVAVVCGNKLYVANVGDSRAVVVCQTPNGSLETLQLSTDHDVKNEDELKRLEQLGLDPEELKRAGRLGPQENTRSIGDYNIKGGYKSVDILSHASGPPGTAVPSVITVDIEESFLYLMVMSDGVYKSIEAAVDEAQTIGAFNAVANWFHAHVQMDFASASQRTLSNLAHIHEKAYMQNLNPTACRKRDDMTLLVYTFHDQVPTSDPVHSGRKQGLFERLQSATQRVYQLGKTTMATLLGSKCPHSEGTVENARYHLGESSRPDHANEDRHCIHVDDGTFHVLAVFDGHDGPQGAEFSHQYFMHLFSSSEWRQAFVQGEDVEQKMKESFRRADEAFFEHIKIHRDEKSLIQHCIEPGLKSYEVQQHYPGEVARLAQLEPLISGGCTAVVAVVCGNNLHVANVGDSRAVVVYQTPNGTLETLQLSTDHDVKNVDELKRLEQLGLDPEELKRAGRLGPQEKTRSIGDYNIKGGYKSVDILSHASGPPGTAVPSVITVDIEESFLYLMVMSDGVYKSIEAAVDEAQTIGANQVLANMVHASAQTPGVEFSSIAQSTLDQVAHLHEEAFQRSAQQDTRSPKAIACRKRDDMTLVVYTFRGSK